MEVKQIQQVQQEVITDVICDSCGKSCNDPFYGVESMRLKANWGYASGKDFQTWQADICEQCVDEKFGFIKFKKTSSISGMDLNT